MREDIIQVTSGWEEHSHVQEARCVCGKGYIPGNWELHPMDGKFLEVCYAKCAGCGTIREFWFDVSTVFEPGASNVFSDLQRAWPPVARGEPYFADIKLLSRDMEALRKKAETSELDSAEADAELFQLIDRAYPRILGRYQVLGVRQGGMSTLYLCRDVQVKEFHRLVVCKMVQTVDQESRQLLRHEAGLWLKLGHHRNLVTLYDIEVISDEQLVLVLELVYPSAGGRTSIRDWLRESALSPQKAISIVRGIVSCMQHCRSRIPGFVHGDLKPENLLLDLAYEVRVTDFGLARSRDLAGPLLGGNLGTLEYLAPECWSGAGASEASDVYALGIIAYELLMEQHPFHRTPYERLQFSHEKEFIRIQHPLLSTEESDLLTRCVSKSPSLRPDFEELADRLGAAYGPEELNTSSLVAAKDANNLGTALAALGRHTEAISSYRTALRLDPVAESESPTLVNLAMSLSRTGNYQAAEYFYQKALGHERSAHGLSSYAAHLLRSDQRERYEEALELCDEAIALDSGLLQAHINKAAILNSLGRHEDAIAAGEAARQLDPKNPNALLEVAYGQARTGRKNQAWKLAERILKTHPNFGPAKRLLAMLKKK